MSGADDLQRRLGVPATQNNLARATELAFAAAGGQSQEQLRWLGAERAENGWRLPVLGDSFHVDPSAGRVTTSAGKEVGHHWVILALHYLAITSRPERRPPETTFADLATARSYAGIYHGRVISRLCATAGRNAATLSAAAGALGGRPAVPSEGHVPCPSEWAGDLAFDFDAFPRLSMRLIWHAPDDEFPASATLLLPDNIESYLCSEDIVVLSESLVARLGERPF